jgi:uncharacterized membrane-anchored protein YhcB (DUF1043 family)
MNSAIGLWVLAAGVVIGGLVAFLVIGLSTRSMTADQVVRLQKKIVELESRNEYLETAMGEGNSHYKDMEYAYMQMKEELSTLRHENLRLNEKRSKIAVERLCETVGDEYGRYDKDELAPENSERATASSLVKALPSRSKWFHKR